MPGEFAPCPFCGYDINEAPDENCYPTGTWWRMERWHDTQQEVRRYLSHRDPARKSNDNPIVGVHCPEVSGGCGAELHGNTRAEAVAKWNRRSNAIPQASKQESAT